MPKWNESMKQTFEYYEVDPYTWKDKRPITSITQSNIDVDLESETLGSASFTTTEYMGECYIRVYLITIQNGIREKFPIGTYMVQTPSQSFDGRVKSIRMDAYSPLIELKEKVPPLGFFIPKDTNILEHTIALIRDKIRAPIVKTSNVEKIPYEFVSDPSDTWLSFINDFISSSKHNIRLDELGRVLFEPTIKLDAMAPSWTYTDDNSSILYPAISIDNDLYGIPNVVEVIFSNDEYFLYSKVVNDDEDSPISTINRGREIVHRVTNPEISGTITQQKIDKYAEDLLKEKSSMVYTITYTHGYCPVKVGDCVLLNYKAAGLNNVKAKVISQSISCVPGTPVEEKAIFINQLWR